MKTKLALFAALVLLIVGCTVTPVHTTATVASFDQGAQTSGLVGYYTNATGEVFRVLTPHSRDRYNALIADYGKRFRPPLNVDEGITPFGAYFLIDNGHWVKARTMNRWRTEGLSP